jgi:hypothetical protein
MNSRPWTKAMIATPVATNVQGLSNKSFGANAQKSRTRAIANGGIRSNSLFFMTDQPRPSLSEEYIAILLSQSVCRGQVVK